jgi:hypothetical protein
MERMMPLYEAKMIHHYDTRWATYEPDGTTRLMTENEKTERLLPMPRYWVHEDEIDKKVGDKWDKNWFLGWRRICRATDERTTISSLLPRVGLGDSVFVGLAERAGLAGRHQLAAMWASFAFDYITRQKMGGTNFNFFIMEQMPVPTPDTTVPGLSVGKPFASWMATVVDRLNAWTTSASIRAHLRAELDALMFHVYGIDRTDVDYIMETFPIVKRKDEEAHGEYRTKHLILAAYDAMAEAIATGRPYRSPFTEVSA